MDLIEKIYKGKWGKSEVKVEEYVTPTPIVTTPVFNNPNIINKKEPNIIKFDKFGINYEFKDFNINNYEIYSTILETINERIINNNLENYNKLKLFIDDLLSENSLFSNELNKEYKLVSFYNIKNQIDERIRLLIDAKNMNIPPWYYKLVHVVPNYINPNSDVISDLYNNGFSDLYVNTVIDFINNYKEIYNNYVNNNITNLKDFFGNYVKKDDNIMFFHKNSFNIAKITNYNFINNTIKGQNTNGELFKFQNGNSFVIINENLHTNFILWQLKQ